MDRTSDKHAPRVDDELEREVEPLTRGLPADSRAQESREKEGPADGEPAPDAVISTDGDSPPGSMPHDQVERRREIARYLERRYPATREELLENAIQMHAPTMVIAELERLPAGIYEGFPQVWDKLR
ncbi:MAG TPA: DUF2795 domain-containing protein [Actinomycetota bacterium]|jgi:hypothetical protein|nr:DUF2795 domain-containing protein [Actinomycetota bacterium]